MNATILKKALSTSDLMHTSALDRAVSGSQEETKGHTEGESELIALYSDVFAKSEVRQGISTTRQFGKKEF